MRPGGGTDTFEVDWRRGHAAPVSTRPAGELVESLAFTPDGSLCLVA